MIVGCTVYASIKDPRRSKRHFGMINGDGDDAGPQAARIQRKWMAIHLAERHAMKDGSYVDQSMQQEASSVPSEHRNEELQHENLTLKDDKAFLTQYVSRLMKILRHFLQKYGEVDALQSLSTHSTEHEAESGADIPPPWCTSSEVINPLLLAYDVRIAELLETIQENKNAISTIAARSESISKENESLRKELEVCVEKLATQFRLNKDDPSAPFREIKGSGIDSMEASDYLAEMNERLDSIMAENNLLMEQISLQDEEIHTAQKDVADRDEQLEVMEKHFRQATSTLQELRESCETLRNERRHSENQIQEYAIRIAQLDSNRELLEEQRDAYKSEIRSLEDQLKNSQNAMDEIKASHEQNHDKFSKKYQILCARLRELTNASDAKDKIIDDLELRSQAMRFELEAAKQDCEGMLKVLNAMDRQLNQYCSREDAVAELEAECKARVSETLLEKEKISSREAQGRREITRLMERLRAEAVRNLKERDEILRAHKKKHEVEVSQLENTIASLSANIGHLRAKSEAASRAVKDAEKRLEDAYDQLKQLPQSFETELQALGKRLTTVEEARDEVGNYFNAAYELTSHVQALGRESEYVCRLKYAHVELDKAQSDYREHSQRLREKLSQMEQELESYRHQLRDLKSSCEEKDRKNQMISDQLIRVKADHATRFGTELEALTIQNQKLKQKLMEVDLRRLQAEKDGQNTAENAARERERLEKRSQMGTESWKSRVCALYDENRRLECARRDSEANGSVIALQLQELAQDFSELKDLYSEREEACDDAEGKIADLSSQLNGALSKQQQMYRKEREMRSTIERMMREKTRMERDSAICRKKLQLQLHNDQSDSIRRIYPSDTFATKSMEMHYFAGKEDIPPPSGPI
uniref:Uncharacterized protein AlNc14C246G9564 n=1 Tax=Albugo laibachii Nc14 TaxID=890382 RepID=F0WT79_9STRA|nr:conserved hypothetical protein [Albugo laibachii Nc14]|eukprot:CCA24567.1 conserved hypothetical protein [Albugo laibachii Nc14]